MQVAAAATVLAGGGEATEARQGPGVVEHWLETASVRDWGDANWIGFSVGSLKTASGSPFRNGLGLDRHRDWDKDTRVEKVGKWKCRGWFEVVGRARKFVFPPFGEENGFGRRRGVEFERILNLLRC